MNSPQKREYKNHNYKHQVTLAYNYIQPETYLEELIIAEEAWLEGAFWGKPRYGHPEGKVLYHIAEVLANIDKLELTSAERRRLRLITIIHDTFKYKEEKVRPRIDWSQHHAVIARKFARNFIEEEAILDIIELHDEAYYAWLKYKKGQKEKADKQIAKIKNCLSPKDFQLFYLFFKCDTQTGDKTQVPIQWFEKTVKGIEVIQF